METKKDHYTSTQAIEILHKPQRRITHLVDKGVVIAFQNAKGAGSKRLYSYLNLLEFSLAEALFDLDLGIHLVRKILSNLRSEEILELWAENFKTHFKKLAKEYKQRVLEYMSKHEDFDPTFICSERKEILLDWRDEESILKGFMPQTQTGNLFYCFKKDGTDKIIIFPWDFELYMKLPFLQKEILDSKGVIMIDLGEIKGNLDKAITNIG